MIVKVRNKSTHYPLGAKLPAKPVFARLLPVLHQKLDTEEIHRAAERIAFSITNSDDLGLSPTRGEIKKSLLDYNLEIGDDFENCLDALEFMKLARSDSAEISGDQRTFTFSHRRFQEYFATIQILNEGKVSITELLTNPRLRESAVVICQTQSIEIISPLIEVAKYLLASHWETIDAQLASIISENGKEIPIDFPWPRGCLHLLDLLQDGFVNRINLLPEFVRKLSGSIVTIATIAGSLPHRIWALEVAGISPTSDLLEIIRPAIADKSHFLSDVAYRQAARLDEIPDDIRTWIKGSILKKLINLGIFRGSNIVYAQVSRLANARDHIAVVRGIQFGHWIDIVSSVIISGIYFALAFAMPLASINGPITWRIIMITMGLLALSVPVNIYSEELYQLIGFMYAGLILSFLVPVILLLKANFYIIIFPAYALFVMPSIVAAIDEIPFKKNLVYVLFSPFFVVRKAAKGFRMGLRSLKTASFQKLSRRSKRSFAIVITFLIVYCFLEFMLIESEIGRSVIAAISTLGMLIMFSWTISKTLLQDRKYAKVWKSWLRIPRNKITTNEIIDVLQLVLTRHAYKLFETVREDGLLEPSRENLHFLNELIRLVENPILENEFSESLSQFLDDVRDNKLKSMLLDELFQLIEEMKSKLQ